MKTYQKLLLWILGSVLIITGVTQLYFSFYLDEHLKNITVDRFHEATNEAYDLEIDDFDLQIIGRELTLSDITLTKKEKQVTDIQLTVDNFSASGIGFLRLLFFQKLRLDEITFTNPKIYLTSANSDTQSQFEWISINQKLSDIALHVLDDITIPEIRIQGLSLDYNRADLSVNPFISFNNSDVVFHDVTIDSTNHQDDRIIPSEHIDFTLRDVEYTPNDLYEISTKSIEFSSTNSSILLTDLALSPRYRKGDFSEKVGHQTDRLHLAIERIVGNQINTEQLDKAEGLTAGFITITTPDLDVYRDKRKPDHPKSYKPLPQEMIRGIPFPTSIDSIRIKNGNIRYTERSPEANRAGYIKFADLSAIFKDLTNVEEELQQGKTPTLHVETDVMDRAQLDANFTFYMNDIDNRQQIEGSLQPMDMPPLNDALEPLAFVRIDQGTILGLDFEMNLTSKQAGGSLTLLYEDLKISLLDKESNKETFGNKAKSLLANTFKIKSSNSGNTPRSAEVDFERDDQKSIFNYWWKSLLSGLKSTIGL